MTQLDHVTINVLDMDKSIAFYENVMGLTKLNQVDMGDHVIQYFDLNGTLLEMISYKFETGEESLAADTKGVYRHLALSVDDIEAVYQAVKDSGVATITMELGTCEKLSFKNFLMRDPNGVEVEVLTRY